MRFQVNSLGFACMGALLFVLSACSGINLMSHSFSAGNQSKDIEGKFVDTVLPNLNTTAESENGSAIEGQWDAGVRHLRYGNRTVANLPQLRAYANGVLARLHAGISNEKIRATVYITPQQGFQAYTLEHGDIFVSLGALLALESEDELAALLAHEYAHVLLYHHSKNALESFTRSGMQYASIYLQSSTDSMDDLQKRMIALYISRWVTDKALFTNWNRGQENDADILAVDLLTLANYNADGMLVMLKKMQITVGERQAFVSRNPISIKETGERRKTYRLNLNVLANNILGGLEDKLDRDYESAKVRQMEIRGYLKKEHPKRPRPPMKSGAYQASLNQSGTSERVGQYVSAHKAQSALLQGKEGLEAAAVYGQRALGGELGEDPYTRMVMFHIRYSQQKGDRAVVNLQKAYATGQSGIYTYELLVQLHLEQKQYAEAGALLTEMEAIFDKPVGILPDQIRVKAQLGESTSVSQLRCIATGDFELIDQCDLAYQETKKT